VSVAKLLTRVAISGELQRIREWPLQLRNHAPRVVERKYESNLLCVEWNRFEDPFVAVQWSCSSYHIIFVRTTGRVGAAV